MKRDLTEVEERLRATYQAVAATTVVGAENRDTGPTLARAQHAARSSASPPLRHRPCDTGGSRRRCSCDGDPTRALPRRARRRHRSRPHRAPQRRSRPRRTLRRPAQRPHVVLNCPGRWTCRRATLGPERMASSVDGQLALGWTSATGSIVARWPPDPQFQQLLGHPAPTSDGQPSVSGSGTSGMKQIDNGAYVRTMVFSLRNVPAECRTIQVDIVDTDPARVDAGVARLSNRGLFVSTAPLVVGSEQRSAAPTVVDCNAPAGAAVPPKRGGPVRGGPVFASPAEALSAFLDADSSLIRNQYLEVRLPDSSIAYAKEQPERPGMFVTVVHVVRAGDGWSVDRWEASGC